MGLQDGPLCNDCRSPLGAIPAASMGVYGRVAADPSTRDCFQMADHTGVGRLGHRKRRARSCIVTPWLVLSHCTAQFECRKVWSLWRFPWASMIRLVLSSETNKRRKSNYRSKTLQTRTKSALIFQAPPESIQNGGQMNHLLRVRTRAVCYVLTSYRLTASMSSSTPKPGRSDTTA